MKKVFFLFVLLCAIAQGTWAQEPYITDVIVIGDDDSGDADDKYHDYERAGWIGKVRDLNDGAGGHYIYLLYKCNTSTGSSGTPITDFYLWVSATTPGPVSLTHMGRTYYRVGCDGDSQFRNSGGDLNCKAGGDYIHLYYAKEATSPVRINFIQFDNQPYNPCNCVGLNGSVVAADLNLGAGGDDIYMHVYKHLASSPAPIYTEGQLSDAVAITPGAPNLKLMNDINLSKNLVIGDIDHNRTASVTLDLNGYTLNRGLNSSIDLGSVIRVEPKSSLTINDSSDNPDTPEYDGTGTITGGYTNQDGGGIVNHGTLTINGAMTINPFRAYLQLNGATAQTRSIVLNIGDETTEIEVKGVKEVLGEPSDQGRAREVLGEPSDQGRANDDSWYSLDGRRLDGKPTAKGIYIHGGKKVMIK